MIIHSKSEADLLNLFSLNFSFNRKEEQKKLDEMTVEREHIGKTLNPQAQVILDTAKSQVLLGLFCLI